jgi:transposase
VERRLVGIDLGIASAHTVRVLDGAGREVCRRQTGPTVAELSRIEDAALAGAGAGTRLEVVMEPTGPSWLPVAVFFCGRGHVVHRVSSAKAADLRRFLSRHAKSNGIDADTLARLPLIDPGGLRELTLPGEHAAALDRRVRATDRLTRAASEHKVRIKDLVRQLMPATPLTGELGQADLAVLERWADPRALLAAGPARLIRVIEKSSHGQQGAQRAAVWRGAAMASVELYAAYPGMPFTDLAAEVASEVRLLRAVTAELAEHAAHREDAYRWADPGQLARSLPGLAVVGAPALVAVVGDAARFPSARHLRSFTGLAPRASETGDTDRKGQPMSKAGPALLRTTLVRAADNARRQDPQLARIYYLQIVERGANHTKALCVVAAALAERAWTVLRRGMPYVICDTDATPVDPARAKQIIAEQWTVPADVRARRRSSKHAIARTKAGKAPQQVHPGQDRSDTRERRQTRRPSPPAILTRSTTTTQENRLTTDHP